MTAFRRDLGPAANRRGRRPPVNRDRPVTRPARAAQGGPRMAPYRPGLGTGPARRPVPSQTRPRPAVAAAPPRLPGPEASAPAGRVIRRSPDRPPPEPLLGPALHAASELAVLSLSLALLAVRLVGRAARRLARAGARGTILAARAVPAGARGARRLHLHLRQRARARSRQARAPWLSTVSRFRCLLVVFILLFLAVVGKLVDIQVLNAERYNAWGLAQRQRTVALPAGRGAVLDRHGVDLAISVPQSTIWADPDEIQDPAAAATALAPLLDRPRGELEAELRGPGRFVYLARQVDDATAWPVIDLDLPGIHYVEEAKRFRPSEPLARSVLGQVDIDGKGIAGAESMYDTDLAGRPGLLTVERAPAGATIAGSRETVEPPRPGRALLLTLDRSMQYETERALAEQVRATEAKGGMAIVSRPGTGEILAMANVEVKVGTGEVVPSTTNSAAIANFEPGSVNKVITVSAVVNEGLVDPDTTLRVPDRLAVADAIFSDDHEHATEPMTVHEILSQSSNVGTIMLAQQLGKEKLDEYLQRFGLGQPTALGFPNEGAGDLLPPGEWSGTSIGSIPIGQGISVTATQMLAAFNVVANAGTYVPPRLLAATVDADGTRHPAPVAPTHPVIRPEVAVEVQSMMEEVVDDGTGTAAAVPGYRVAGKTGTARKPLPTGGYRDADGQYHYVSSFAGFVPGQSGPLSGQPGQSGRPGQSGPPDPAQPSMTETGAGLSIMVVIDEPKTSIYAGDVAAPVFSQLATYGLRQFRIPPG